MRGTGNLLWLLPLFVSGCGRPEINWGIATFNHKERWHEAVSFRVDLPDSLTTIGLDICAQFHHKGALCGHLPVILLFQAPDSTLFCDTVSLPLNVVRQKQVYRKNGEAHSIRWPYRRGIINRKPGQWNISLLPDTSRADSSLFENVMAVGIAVERESE